MTSRVAGPRPAPSTTTIVLAVAMLLACSPDVAPSTSSTSSTATGDATVGATTAGSSSTSVADGPTTAADSSSSGGGLQEYVGYWSQGTTDTKFTYREFKPCGAVGTLYVEGALPEIEECDGVESMYLRVIGEVVPGGDGPTLVVHEVLEGPCWEHTCNGGDSCHCTTFEALCSALPSECDLVHQDCPEGEKCMPWANDGGMQWNTTRCSPLADRPGQVGEPCMVEGWALSGIDDCDLGLVCWNVDIETNMGTCAALCEVDQCRPDPFCEDPSTTCADVADGALQMCLPMCDPLAPGCAPGNSCQQLDRGTFCLP